MLAGNFQKSNRNERKKETVKIRSETTSAVEEATSKYLLEWRKNIGMEYWQ